LGDGDLQEELADLPSLDKKTNIDDIMANDSSHYAKPASQQIHETIQKCIRCGTSAMSKNQHSVENVASLLLWPALDVDPPLVVLPTSAAFVV